VQETQQAILDVRWDAAELIDEESASASDLSGPWSRLKSTVKSTPFVPEDQVFD
jgi:hypothetical protein